MIVEYTRYKVKEEQQIALEQAYESAQHILAASPYCLAYELSRCIEEPAVYILRIEWSSSEDHLKGFRGSPEFGTFFAAVRPFFHDIQEMRHYEVTSIVGQK